MTLVKGSSRGERGSRAHLVVDLTLPVRQTVASGQRSEDDAVHVNGQCEICGEDGKRVQVKPHGGQLQGSHVGRDSGLIVLCGKHLYTMHGFFPALTDDGASDRRKRRAEVRERLQRTVA